MVPLGTTVSTTDSCLPARASTNIIQLRKLLSQRFPELRQSLVRRRRPECLATGIAALDELLQGGLPRGQFTEVVAPGQHSGSAEVIHALLRQIAATRQFLALVDGAGSFDAGAVDPAVLTRLLWVQCRQASEALKATDLLLRDRNFPLLVLDLKLNSSRELRRITASIWFRYARLLEQSGATVLVITPHPLVTVAACRLAMDSALDLAALDQMPCQRLARLRFTLCRNLLDENEAWSVQVG